ncbi:[FeFe] hydrogenase H-cluster maturation GTPase HydF [Miniphocaeibacter halophilus]|uniref:[FeFe] hydrogenase H-cluster maturation GTPase HydF n=2 Tax=Miniphocaeibacter halophilus TaxID=2931922 RepID=A0AC61MZF9_9FIRM|nr:[FeFe] hydrogenase H-cluster maturation GTPase HydF [Miniphocaeibacter halophilus]
METTARSNRKYIGLIGRRNVGKSTIINLLTGQETSIVSDFAGTTTDNVQKNMELHGVGPVVFVDTAGYDDIGEIGQLRVEKTKRVLNKLDVALLIIENELTDFDKKWVNLLKEYKIDFIPILNKDDIFSYSEDKIKEMENILEKNILVFSINKDKNIIIEELGKKLAVKKEKTITGSLVNKNSLVMLVMPQDKEAPKGRLILPQVQTIRELIDKNAITIAVDLEQVEEALKYLNKDPDLIITDSKVFEEVYKLKPKNSLLTSFSVLFAALKGDIDYFVKSANTIEKLNNKSRILIAEACTHPPITEDIGTVRIPNMIRKKYGENIEFDFVRGDDFPKDLKKYDLVIHCGACMFNEKHVESRVSQAKKQNIPFTNYGVTIAKIKGILNKVVLT